MKKFQIYIACLVFVIGLGAIDIDAQIYNPNQYSNPVIQKMYYNQLMTTKAIGGLIRIDMLKSGGKTKSSRSNQVKRDPLQFRSTNVTVITDQELDLIAKNPKDKKELEDFFNNCLKLYTATAAKDRFPYNDLAYAFNYFVVNNYHIYKNVLEDMDKYSTYDVLDLTKVPNYIYFQREQAIYGQFRNALSQNPAVGKLTDAEKEKFTAQMAIMTGVPFIMYDAALKAKNKEAIKNAQEMAKQNLENIFGKSPEDIIINDSGISFKER